ncbi:MAG: hypothetical protein IJO06_06840 [Thermoguttaceae bacterium]|nr:hypothetical protein [Thermoguttaceae bacterium]
MERERNERAANGAEKDGIRKAALFLSILDAEAAEALLARFEPNVARAVEAEARRVGSVAPEDVDAIVAEFLALSEPEETPREPKDPEKPESLGEPESWEKPEGWVKSEGLGGLESWGKPGKSEEADGAEAANGRKDRARTEERNAFFDGRTGDDGGELQPLDAIEPKRLARLLSGASRTTIAVALARLSERRRSAVVALLPTEKARGAERASSALVRTTDAARRLEEALFNGALDDE